MNLSKSRYQPRIAPLFRKSDSERQHDLSNAGVLVPKSVVKAVSISKAEVIVTGINDLRIE